MRRRGLKAGVLVLEEGYMTCSLGSFRGGIVELLFLFFSFSDQIDVGGEVKVEGDAKDRTWRRASHEYMYRTNFTHTYLNQKLPPPQISVSNSTRIEIEHQHHQNPSA